MAYLDDCKLHDKSLEHFKKAIGVMEKAGLPQAAVHGWLQHLTNAYARGVDFPMMGNAMLAEADRLGVEREVIAKAAKKAGYAKSGANPRKNLRDRLTATRAQVKAMESARPVPAAELVGYAELLDIAKVVVKRRP